MSDILDQFSKSLASGASRRRALSALVAGSAFALPFTAEGKKNKNKRKRKLRKKFAPYQQACEDWCRVNSRLPNATVNFGLCVNDAKEGKGPCFSGEASGAVCLDRCAKDQFCCPTLFASGGVASTECCTTPCGLTLNNTLICNT
ncbi:MAG: hypothetical protein KC442_17805 [Thermomicrobiales bacterium]|nr:hypothetical protein [Thermomicrobiales bacterium]